MKVREDIRKCVMFVGYEKPDGMNEFAGTAFLVANNYKEPKFSFNYIVTAKHVIDNIRDKGCNKVLLRMNFNNGNAQWAESDISNWRFHPDDSEIDVAILPLSPVKDSDHLACPLGLSATEKIIKTKGIGIGDDVFLTGLFVNHYGQRRNIPIIRVGNISAMPEEKVETRFGLIDAYLVEARSIGGLSGSPVFVHLGETMIVNGEMYYRKSREGFYYLLGLMHGHFASNFLDIDTSMDGAFNRDKINMGIAIVVPVSKILEVIYQPEIRNMEKQDLDILREN